MPNIQQCAFDRLPKGSLQLVFVVNFEVTILHLSFVADTSRSFFDPYYSLDEQLHSATPVGNSLQLHSTLYCSLLLIHLPYFLRSCRMDHHSLILHIVHHQDFANYLYLYSFLSHSDSSQLFILTTGNLQFKNTLRVTQYICIEIF